MKYQQNTLDLIPGEASRSILTCGRGTIYLSGNKTKKQKIYTNIIINQIISFVESKEEGTKK
jgi:hypothetical protein